MTRIDEFLKNDLSWDDPLTDYLVAKLIPAQQVVLTAGVPGEGKSFFTQAMINHVAYGAPFLGYDTSKGPVLIIDSENPRKVLVDRFKKIRKGLEGDGFEDPSPIEILSYSGFKLDDEKTWDEAIRIVEEINPVLITLDHLLCFHDQKENSSNGMNRVADGISKLSNICGSTVSILHHFNKKTSGTFYQRLRGSTVIYARSEAAFEIRALSHEAGKLQTFGIIPQARKGKLTSPIRVRLEETEDTIKLLWDGIYDPVDDPILDRIAHMVAHIFTKEPKERTVEGVIEIMAKMGSETEIREALRVLEKKGVVKTRRSGSSHKYVYDRGTSDCPWCAKA